MHTFGALELDIKPGTPDTQLLSGGLLRYPRDEDGRLFSSPESASLEELDGQINPSKTNWDEIRERARRAFQVT